MPPAGHTWQDKGTARGRGERGGVLSGHPQPHSRAGRGTSHASVGSDPSSHDSGPLGYKGLREGLRETDRRGEETHHLSREAVFTFVWGFTTQFMKAITKIALGPGFPIPIIKPVF